MPSIPHIDLEGATFVGLSFCFHLAEAPATWPTLDSFCRVTFETCPAVVFLCLKRCAVGEFMIKKVPSRVNQLYAAAFLKRMFFEIETLT